MPSPALSVIAADGKTLSRQRPDEITIPVCRALIDRRQLPRQIDRLRIALERYGSSRTEDVVFTSQQLSEFDDAMTNWDQFDPRAYVAANYTEMQADDAALVRLAAEAFVDELPGLHIVDIGTGPNLYPLMAMAPRATSITACELGAANIRWLRDSLAADALEPMWKPYFEIVRNVYSGSLPESPIDMLREKVVVQNTSIFDLEDATYDAASMFFCAESITHSDVEFERALHRWARCVRPNGLLVGAFMVGSTGYQTGAAQFPALKLSDAELRAALSAVVNEAAFQSMPRVEGRRSGYDGILFVSARAR